MDSETIAASAGLITAAVGLIGAIGAGIWKLISRADRKRENREALLIPTLKAQVEAKDKELDEQRRLIRWHEQVEAIKDDLIHAYREQLIRNDIEPVPLELPAYPARDGVL